MGFKVKMPTTASAELAAACKKMAKAQTACDAPDAPVDSQCDHYALVERPERARAYACWAKLECGADGTACDPGTSTFGQKLCAKADAACGGAGTVCQDGLADFLDLEGAWLRPDVMAAANECAKQTTCTDVNDCFRAWVNAVL
jgi:hypothetical protein